MFTRIALATAAVAAFTIGASAQSSIAGNWRTQSGENATISQCGGAFCIRVTSGEHAGKQIGRVSHSSGNKYTGSITDPGNGKTYSGSAIVNGGSLKLSGCVARVLCRSQNWARR